MLEAAFSVYGKVTDVYTPEGKPMALVTLETQEAAEEGGTALNGRYVSKSDAGAWHVVS